MVAAAGLLLMAALQIAAVDGRWFQGRKMVEARRETGTPWGQGGNSKTNDGEGVSALKH